jgi:hypothetical protein
MNNKCLIFDLVRHFSFALTNSESICLKENFGKPISATGKSLRKNYFFFQNSTNFNVSTEHNRANLEHHEAKFDKFSELNT